MSRPVQTSHWTSAACSEKSDTILPILNISAEIAEPQNNLYNASGNNERYHFFLHLLEDLKDPLLTIPKYKSFHIVGGHHQITKVVLWLEIKHRNADEKPEVKKEKQTSTADTTEKSNIYVIINVSEKYVHSFCNPSV